MLEVYHGTTKEIAQKILRENFKIIHKEVTNDLGNGVYTYCPDEENIWDPQNNARRYAIQYKNGIKLGRPSNKEPMKYGKNIVEGMLRNVIILMG